MADITVTINENQITGHAGITILELAKENGIDIPTLCYCPDLSPMGACRLCVVEVTGSKALMGSCHTPISQGMVIQAHSPKVMATRKIIIELLLASHSSFCTVCDKSNTCELRKLAMDMDIGLSRFQSKKRYFLIEDVSPYITRDLSKCVLCRRCLQICNEVAKKRVFGIGYRGFNSKVIVDLDQPIDKEVCRDCGLCITSCPTGALSNPAQIGEEKKGTPLVIRG